jgi:hypothetical protein
MTVQLLTKSLIAGVAALTVVSTVAITAAEAKDGCGKGMFYNGRQCVAKGERGLRAFDPGFRDRGIDRRADRLSSFDRRWSSHDHRGDRWSSSDRRGDRGVSLGFGGLRVHLGDGKPKFGFDL